MLRQKIITCVLSVLLGTTAGALLAQTGAALVRHAPTLNGRVEGSVQQMLGESATLNGGANVTRDLLVPGTPTVRLNGNPNYGGTRDGAGNASPSNYQVTLNGTATLRHVVRRTDPVALPAVSAPPLPAGTRDVTITSAGQSAGDYATLRHLTLNGGVGQYAVPPGTYGDFTANGGSGFTLGMAGATQPAAYHFQNLTLNGPAQVQVVGPVVVTIANGFAANGTLGAAANPSWFTLNLSSGGCTLNGGCNLYGYVNASNGAVTLAGNSQLIGGVTSDRLTVNGSGLLRLLAAQSAKDGRLPYFTDFEAGEGYSPGPLDGKDGWSAIGPVDVVSASSSSGVQSILLGAANPPAQLGRTFPSYAGQSTVFVDLYGKPAAGGDPASSSIVQADVAAVSFVQANSQGQIFAFNGDGFGSGSWQPTSFKAPVTGGQSADWLRLTLREDFSAKRWDLYANGRLIAYELGFTDNTRSLLSQFSLRGHQSVGMGFDDFFAGFDNPIFIDADKDGMDDAWEAANGLSVSTNDRLGDLDNDGLSNLREYQLGTRANLADTDGDGLGDGQEVANGTDPLAPNPRVTLHLRVYLPSEP